MNIFTSFLLVLALCTFVCHCGTFCEQPFEGFGVFLGSVSHFSNSPEGTIDKVLDRVYNDLQIRYFRTSYEPYFSLSPDSYEIKCFDSESCHWDETHRLISKYENISVFASIWIAPYYLMNMTTYELPPSNQMAYLDYIRNITGLIDTQYGIQIERISPVNEPENVFATWDHTNMGPIQLCKMISSFNDPLISLCPENSYFYVSSWYLNFDWESVNCSTVCPIHATHGYTLNVNPSSPNFLKAYYDKIARERPTTKPIWMTEVSSTYQDADLTQMEEALDLALNIVNMLGTSCIQRYYYWLAYTKYSSGESLIWGDHEGTFELPKKYHVYKHFTTAGINVMTPVYIRRCDDWANTTGAVGISYNDQNAVFVNQMNTFEIQNSLTCLELCCTTDEVDYSCTKNIKTIPANAVCTCKNIQKLDQKGVGDESNGFRFEAYVILYLVAFCVLKCL